MAGRLQPFDESGPQRGDPLDQPGRPPPSLAHQLVEEFALDGLTEADRHSLCRLWHSLSPWPDAIPGLSRLKRQFIIGPLSNGNVSLLTNMAKHAGLTWDMIFSSDLFRHYKPDYETYLGACRLLDLEPRQVMMAAAHNSDLAAARSLGLMTAFFPRSMEYGPNQVRDFVPEADWDVVAGGHGNPTRCLTMASASFEGNPTMQREDPLRLGRSGGRRRVSDLFASSWPVLEVD